MVYTTAISLAPEQVVPASWKLRLGVQCEDERGFQGCRDLAFENKKIPSSHTRPTLTATSVLETEVYE